MCHLTNSLYLDFEKLGAQIVHNAAAARRSVPAPVDFELTLPEFNLEPWQLKKHLRPPRRLPDPPQPSENSSDKAQKIFGLYPDTAIPSLPSAFDVLSGEAARQEKVYIPTHFPPFPSLHTWKYTPVDVQHASAVVSGRDVNEAAEREERRRRTREQARVEAKQGEDALRKLLRASKHREQKEVRQLALLGSDHGARSKRVHWEKAMRHYLSDFGTIGADGPSVHQKIVPGLQKRSSAAALKEKTLLAAEDVGDHSMVVNWEKKAHCQSVSTRRAGATTGK